jgi:hypothetical protein
VTLDDAIALAVARGWARHEIAHALRRLGDVPEPLAVGVVTQMATASSAEVGDHGIDPKVVARIRGLLAKAESTTFPDEAEALSAKAQELLARYALDAAEIAEQADGPAVVVRRLCVDDPYLSAKATLCSRVADANRCRAVWNSMWGVVTIIGEAAAAESAVLLCQSLLRQAEVAVVLQGARRDVAGRSRTRSFRQSFLIAYAARIGERLAAATAASVAERDAATGGALVPLLDRQRAAVAAETDRIFPTTRAMRVSVTNAEGVQAGRAAADRADITPTDRRLAG